MAIMTISPADQESWDRLSDRTVQCVRCVRQQRERFRFMLHATVLLGMTVAAAYVGYQVLILGKSADAIKTVLEAVTPIAAFVGGQFGFSGKVQACDVKLRKVERQVVRGDVEGLITAIAELNCHRKRFDEVYDDARKLRRGRIAGAGRV